MCVFTISCRFFLKQPVAVRARKNVGNSRRAFEGSQSKDRTDAASRLGNECFPSDKLKASQTITLQKRFVRFVSGRIKLLQWVYCYTLCTNLQYCLYLCVKINNITVCKRKNLQDERHPKSVWSLSNIIVCKSRFSWSFAARKSHRKKSYREQQNARR